MKEIQEIVAARLRERRKELGMTQDQVAAACDLSTLMISLLEGQKKWLSPETVNKLASGLRCSPSYFFADQVSTEKPRIPAEILQVLEKCNEDELNFVRQVCNNFVKTWELLAARDPAHQLRKPSRGK